MNSENTKKKNVLSLQTEFRILQHLIQLKLNL